MEEEDLNKLTFQHGGELARWYVCRAVCKNLSQCLKRIYQLMHPTALSN
jgi:hypothetical protein